MNLNALLEAMVKVNASDLHFKIDTPPILRINTLLRPVEHPKLSAQDIQTVIDQIMPERLREQFKTGGAVDFAYSLANISRYRVAAFHQSGSISIAIRRIPIEIPRLEDLNLPPTVYPFTKAHRGQILVTGITGSGKSSTMAAMLREINNTRRSHIVTLEDPIEFLFKDNLSIINQIEVGTDCESFRGTMSHVMRFDPDIVMVGEMRNAETVTAALEAADTGHLVLSTLHTSDAKQTINRILHFFPKDEESLILEQLALNLLASISQRLLPRHDVKGLIPAVEVLINTPIVSKLIREGRIDDIQSALKAKDEGMQSFDMSMANLIREEKISMEVALGYCSDAAALRRMIRGESTAGDSGGLIGGGF